MPIKRAMEGNETNNVKGTTEVKSALEIVKPVKDIDAVVDSVIEEISGSIITVVTMKGSKKFDIGKLFNINQELISDDFSTQASMYAFFAVLAANADRIATMKTLLYDQVAAAADETYRAQFEVDGRKYTEAVIKSMVVRDEEVVKAFTVKEDANYDLAILKAIVRAFEQRAMMLQSLGSQLRHEYDMQGMSIREREIEQISKNVKGVIESRRKIKTEDKTDD
jgi:hypothetical protein